MAENRFITRIEDHEEVQRRELGVCNLTLVGHMCMISESEAHQSALRASGMGRDFQQRSCNQQANIRTGFDPPSEQELILSHM